MKFKICDDCPCENNDYENGSSCNLGYSLGFVKMNNRKFITLSHNCQLNSISFESKTFSPGTVEILDENEVKRICKEIRSY